MLKNIKRFILLIFIGILISSLSACDYSYRLYKKYRKESLIIGIELIRYVNPHAQSNPLDKHLFDLEKLETLEILCADRVDDFIIAISKIGGTTGKFEQVLNSPCGVGVRMIYLDGDFTLITVIFVNGFDTIFVGEYDAEANMMECFGIRWRNMIDDFKDLINEYFTVHID